MRLDFSLKTRSFGDPYGCASIVFLRVCTFRPNLFGLNAQVREAYTPSSRRGDCDVSVGIFFVSALWRAVIKERAPQ